MEVLRCVLIFGRVTAPHVTTFQAQAQMYPGVTHLKTLLAALPRWRDFLDFFQMRAICSCHLFDLLKLFSEFLKKLFHFESGHASRSRRGDGLPKTTILNVATGKYTWDPGAHEIMGL